MHSLDDFFVTYYIYQQQTHMSEIKQAPILKIIGKAMMLGSQQFAIGSVLMSSTFSVKNFSKDQQTLQTAADALRNYIIVGLLWTVANCFVLGATYGRVGTLSAIAANALVMIWMYVCYIKSFQDAQKMYGLQPPNIFF